ncbi:unnamed protein product [Thlaspi arvense]|uniref:RING-type E3 ubiquitin transferase n=1 Tax=Thlaspi arvense TaxID=13288 RepID=A0AAU9S096_THLAR|nr:unnamed protein product [Thlaspi arvense]
MDFEKGLGQKFKQPSGSGIDFSVFEDAELFKAADTDIYPLAVKAEAAPSGDDEEKRVGSKNAQITQAVYEKEKGEIKIRVVKQILWVNEIRYELQEIYGIGNTVDGDDDSADDANDPGKECVICLSEPRDTTVLPCRHMVSKIMFFFSNADGLNAFVLMWRLFASVVSVYVQRMREGVEVSDKSMSDLQATC